MLSRNRRKAHHLLLSHPLRFMLLRFSLVLHSALCFFVGEIITSCCPGVLHIWSHLLRSLCSLPSRDSYDDNDDHHLIFICEDDESGEREREMQTRGVNPFVCLEWWWSSSVFCFGSGRRPFFTSHHHLFFLWLNSLIVFFYPFLPILLLVSLFGKKNGENCNFFLPLILLLSFPLILIKIHAWQQLNSPEFPFLLLLLTCLVFSPLPLLFLLKTAVLKATAFSTSSSLFSVITCYSFVWIIISCLCEVVVSRLNLLMS